MNTSNIITWIISLVALGIASYSLYLQRKDRRPRLNITVENTDGDYGPITTDNYGGSTRPEVPIMVIRAANPTDKPITVKTIKFEHEQYPSIQVPLSKTISTIPPFEDREAVVVVSQLQAEVGIARLGRFIVIDVLGNKHESAEVFV